MEKEGEKKDTDLGETENVGLDKNHMYYLIVCISRVKDEQTIR